MKRAPIRFNMEDIEAAIYDMTGYCIECGAAREACEPDARGYACDICGARAVYGAEELILMGRVGGGARPGVRL